MVLELATFEPAILVNNAVISAASPGGWNGVYPAVNSNVSTPSAQQSTDLFVFGGWRVGRAKGSRGGDDMGREGVVAKYRVRDK